MTEKENPLQALQLQVKELSSRLEELQLLLPDVYRYERLQKLLKQGDFRSADEETTRIMLEVTGEERDSLTPDDVAKYPCNALKVIDRLWQRYSEGKFGFSMQLKTYQQVGGTIDTLRTQDVRILVEFADLVGWLDEKKQPRFEEYDNWDFSLDAPEGCFPAHWWKSPYGLKMVTFFFSRLIACDLA